MTMKKTLKLFQHVYVLDDFNVAFSHVQCNMFYICSNAHTLHLIPLKRKGRGVKNVSSSVISTKILKKVKQIGKVRTTV